MILSDHFPLLVLLAAFLAAFFALLWKDDRAEGRRFFVKALLGLVVSAFLALLWKDDPAEGRRFFVRALLGLVGGAVALGFLFEAVLR